MTNNPVKREQPLRHRLAFEDGKILRPPRKNTRWILGIRALLLAGLFLGFGLGRPSFGVNPLVTPEKKVEPPAAAQAGVSALKVEELFAQDIQTQGMVIDSVTGRPIRDVRMVATTGYLDTSLPSLRRTEKSRQTLDGAFQYSCESCTDATLRFFAEGYRSEIVHLGGPPEEFQGQDLTHPVVNILLEPAVDPVILKRYHARLVVDAEPRKSRVLLLEGGQAMETSWFDIEAKAEESETPLRYLRLLTALDASGQPEARLDQEARYFKVVETAILDFSSADGGVVPYPSGEASPKALRRAMTLAPVDGYQPRLDLDPDSTENVYFYVRLGNLYGRGIARPPVLEQTRSGNRLVATVELHFNPDGTRNLETLE